MLEIGASIGVYHVVKDTEHHNVRAFEPRYFPALAVCWARGEGRGTGQNHRSVFVDEICEPVRAKVATNTTNEAPNDARRHGPRTGFDAGESTRTTANLCTGPRASPTTDNADCLCDGRCWCRVDIIDVNVRLHGAIVGSCLRICRQSVCVCLPRCFASWQHTFGGDMTAKVRPATWQARSCCWLRELTCCNYLAYRHI